MRFIIRALRNFLHFNIPFRSTGAATPGRAMAFRTAIRRDAKLSPAQLLAVSFAGLVAFGTLGLKLLPGLYTGPELGWLDALFTATSAVCVTGLIVVDTATYFTPAGQAFILLLIQLGGLGILGLASLIIITLNTRLSLRQDVIVGAGSAGGAAQNVPVRSLVRDVILFTLVAEGVGFVALFVLWVISPIRQDMTIAQTAWHALFHSVSAFCNAGFSTFSDSLIAFRDRPFTQLVVMGGIIAGGLGFLTLEELKLWWHARRQNCAFRLSLHTQVVLVATAVLILLGWIGLGALEWKNPSTLGGLSWPHRVVNALFLAVTPRTAGFNTIDYGSSLPATKFFTILLMSIGGAPGSTAGGVKVTTIGILAAMAWGRFRARTSNDLWSRTLPDKTAQRAIGLFVFAFMIVTGGIALLTVTELGTSFRVAPAAVVPPAALPPRTFDFLDYMFEAVSAFNTVGLSTGPTGWLSDKGRLLLVVLMFVGRIGPLTFAAALSREDPRERLVRRYAHEDVIVG